MSSLAEIELEEDKQSREYERQMLVDPATGEIPYNIKRDEQVFAKQRYQEQLLNPQPTSASGASATQKFGSEAAIGPENYGGRTRALALDVRDEDIVLAGGVSGGMWRSTNFGANWSKRTKNDQIQSVTAITQDIRTGRKILGITVQVSWSEIPVELHKCSF